MASNDNPRSPVSAVLHPLGFQSRRGSVISLSGSGSVDKEQLAQALDQIHSTASHSDTLTTFKEFAPPPPPSTTTENKGLAGDLMQHGLSGLYNRLRDAVGGGKDKATPTSPRGDGESFENLSVKGPATPTLIHRGSSVPSRDESIVAVSPAQVSTTSSRLQSPTVSSFAPHTSDAPSQIVRPSKTSTGLSAASKLSTSSRPPIAPMTKATSSTPIVPTVAPINVNAFKDGDKNYRLPGPESNSRIGKKTAPERVDDVPVTTGGSPSFGFSATHPRKPRVSDQYSMDGSVEVGEEDADGDATPSADSKKRLSETGSLAGYDGVISKRTKSIAAPSVASSALSSIRVSDATRLNTTTASRLAVPESVKRPTAIERITQSHLPGYQASRASSSDRSTADTTTDRGSSQNSGTRELHTGEDGRAGGYLNLRFRGLLSTDRPPQTVNVRLEQMRKQVYSKEFWMADDICKECFLCGDAFSAFRRKHHCRTCGCIFDSKCTSTISGQRFGVQGSLRVCKTCLDIINRRHDSSGSDDSDIESEALDSPQLRQDKSQPLIDKEAEKRSTSQGNANREDKSRPLATPMMAIPAARRIGESSNRRSAVLEIDAQQVTRPGSSRSIKPISGIGRPPSSGHRRHPSKHNISRLKSLMEDRAPFHRAEADGISKKSRLPAFHDDNIIDPDLAPYMSDEGSSEDEQMSIFATLNSNINDHSYENDRSGFGSLLSGAKRHRSRIGEKGASAMSFSSRGMDDLGTGLGAGPFTRPNRRRNLSVASNILHLQRTSPRQSKSPVFGQSYANLDEVIDNSSDPSTPIRGHSRMTRSASMVESMAPAIELNSASLRHVQKLLHQLLEDASIPNVTSWENALMPILLQCTDDVNPDVRGGDDIDIRHYVKLKKIPGGKPGDTSYVSGVVFTKKLALKSMPRRISNPRIVIVSFPIEYSRHQSQFMSLEPVIAQEKDFLRNMVNRIASLRPQLLLVQKHISGLALQYLADAGIAVAYNVKQSVIEAVSRCAQTEIISSIDMVALKPVHIGKSAAFDVKTYVHQDIPGRKRTYMYISGCPKDLGCTIVLRGASMSILSKMKRITEFMVYVVYNLKLETCLMRDEFVLIPSATNTGGKTSPSREEGSRAIHDSQASLASNDIITAASEKLQHVLEANGSQKSRSSLESTAEENQIKSQPLDSISAEINHTPSQPTTTDDHCKDNHDDQEQLEGPKLVSAHASHAHGAKEDPLPEDIPMPTFYSDMVAKYQTKILSASPFVKFSQPYLLMRAREQERRLVYFKRLRDQDYFEEQSDTEKSTPQKFELIKPEMVHETVSHAPKQIMEVLHAVHDAEYDKALHNYQTQTRQWENFIQANINLFDPFAHQNIVVLYTVVCTETSIPCAGPDLLALAFYNEYENSRDFDPDCTLGQYVEDLCISANTICTSNGCDRKMSEHHRTYVHGEARITVLVEKYPSKIPGLQDSILMWSYCKVCKKETQVMPMSESAWKYSFGKYLELSFSSTALHLRAGFCPHDLHRDHIRYFGYRNVAIRVHWDPIDLLEIVVPRARITWKVENDLRLKNELYTKIEERWNRFMSSVKARIKGINVDSVAAEKVEACKAEIERLAKKANEDHGALLRKLQEKYMTSKYYEVIPLNRAMRAMQENVVEWDTAFSDFDNNFFPSEKDIRRLAALQLKKMFMDREESSSSLPSLDSSDIASDIDEKSARVSSEITRESSTLSTGSPDEAHESFTSVENSIEQKPERSTLDTELQPLPTEIPVSPRPDPELERIEPLDLAIPVLDESPNVLLSEAASMKASSPIATPQVDENIPTLDTLGGSTLTERVENLRRQSQISHYESSNTTSMEMSGIPRPVGPSRRSGLAVSPPIVRTQSQPTTTIRRLNSGSSKLGLKYGESKVVSDALTGPSDSKAVDSTRSDKKLADRLGLGALKSNRKPTHSLIPRSVNRKESKVSTLAKHWEQLSREFEKERLRDKELRAKKVSQARAFPKATSKQRVSVYKSAYDAVEEEPPEETKQILAPGAEKDATAGDEAEARSAIPQNGKTSAEISPAEGTSPEVEADHDQRTGSDDEWHVSEVDNSLIDDDNVHNLDESGESLNTAKSSELQEELPKHEKSSLMKMLTNFWAERSASGWTSLDYPMNLTDHVFQDSDVIVREDEPSSLIAFALSSQDYKEKLAKIRAEGRLNSEQERSSVPNEFDAVDLCNDGIDQAEVETSLLRATGTHLAYSFEDATAKMQCKIFFAEQFDAVRRKCGVSDRIVESLSRCLKWDSKGGKTKSVFLKTLDDRMVLKSLSPIETQAFLRFAPAYFNIMSEALFHDLPSVIAKMFGFYQVTIKNPYSGTELKLDLLLMENLFYDRSPNRIFDLKGSMRNRKIQSTGEQNEVLLDENMVEFIYESPLFAREHSKKLLRAAIFNDTLFLQRNDVMDYSLMVAVDETRKELVVGIIDVVRTYTWDKKLESWIKDRGFAGGGRNRPTVTSPKEYKFRFREAMNRYILQAPNSWYQWPQLEAKSQSQVKNEPVDERPDDEFH
ncbi:1-phosphatidylinositol-3-phosphate 5-kinase-like protein FAB1 [Xylogone sp. PMI_703]|nr:1-phosphatidylinositol-3-phosphate 5-kinase-like protein FAB1 [Xylogone sp. PMI_703]